MAGLLQSQVKGDYSKVAAWVLKKKPPKGKVISSKLQETQFDYFLL